jgi:hypothetical protein
MDPRAVWMTVLFLGLAVAPAWADGLVGPVYPGAVPVSSDRPGWFLSGDPYERVKAYYVKDSGAPARERTVDEGRTAFIEYMDVREVQTYDSVGSALGVQVFERPGRPSAAADVLGMLKGMAMNGMLSRSEYAQLEETYRPVTRWFFPRAEGSGRSLDEVIYERCEKGPAEEALARDAEATAARVQELMMQGKQQEALALMQRMAQSAGDHHASHGVGEAGAARWKECLAEMKRSGYPTRIEIHRHPAASSP